MAGSPWRYSGFGYGFVRFFDTFSGDFFRRHRDENMGRLEPHNFGIREFSASYLAHLAWLCMCIDYESSFIGAAGHRVPAFHDVNFSCFDWRMHDNDRRAIAKEKRKVGQVDGRRVETCPHRKVCRSLRCEATLP